MSLRQYAARFLAACASLSLIGAANAQTSTYLRELDLMSGQDLAQVRENCAQNHMPGILAKVQRDNPGERLPQTDSYCLKALSVSAGHGYLADLYMGIALQERGYSEFAFADDAKLLQHDEAGTTTGAILRAANAGASSYVSITGKSRALTCPLALDAGFTWGYRNSGKSQPYALNAESAAAIVRACYDPSIRDISVAGQTMPAQKAGLYAGAWMGRQQSIGY